MLYLVDLVARFATGCDGEGAQIVKSSTAKSDVLHQQYKSNIQLFV
jgi:hypothetical protein